MKHIKLQLKRLSAIQIAVIILIIGLFTGILFANILKDSYANQLIDYQKSVFPDISSGTVDYFGLFLYILINNLKEFFIFWLLCITILGIPYMAFKIVSFGFVTGFFISAVTMQYGAKGILLVLVYNFPHGLFYLPVALVCLYKGYYLCRAIYHENRNRISSLTGLLKAHFIIILLLAFLLLIGSFLEAYAGAFLLKKTLGLFI